MLVAMSFRGHKPAGDWLYPLISSLAMFIFAAVAVYLLTSAWRERTKDVTAETPVSSPSSPSALEILDRRLAAGEITIEEYEKLIEVLSRRHAVPAGGGGAATAAANGAATVAH
jgi:uncharacterized membrane protein